VLLIGRFHDSPFRRCGKSILIGEAASQYEIYRHTLKRLLDQKASVAIHLYGSLRLSEELKIFSYKMKSDLAKHVKKIPNRFLSKKAIGAIPL